MSNAFRLSKSSHCSLLIAPKMNLKSYCNRFDVSNIAVLASDYVAVRAIAPIPSMGLIRKIEGDWKRSNEIVRDLHRWNATESWKRVGCLKLVKNQRGGL
jgi:hypothetical protein